MDYWIIMEIDMIEYVVMKINMVYNMDIVLVYIGFLLGWYFFSLK